MDEYIFDARSMLNRGLVGSVDDTGQAQVITVTAHDGHTRTDVEVMQQFGIGSRPPADGAVALLLAIGGDPANTVALALGNPSARFGGLNEGEVVVYGSDGSRMHIQQGGSIDIQAATQVLMKVDTVSATVTTGGISLDVGAAGTFRVSAGTTTLTLTEAGIAFNGAATFGGGNATLNGSLQVNGAVNATGTIHGA